MDPVNQIITQHNVSHLVSIPDFHADFYCGRMLGSAYVKYKTLFGWSVWKKRYIEIFNTLICCWKYSSKKKQYGKKKLTFSLDTSISKLFDHGTTCEFIIYKGVYKFGKKKGQRCPKFFIKSHNLNSIRRMYHYLKIVIDGGFN